MLQNNAGPGDVVHDLTVAEVTMVKREKRGMRFLQLWRLPSAFPGLLPICYVMQLGRLDASRLSRDLDFL